MPTETQITKEAAQWAASLKFEDLPAEALRIAKRCILDGLGLILAGSEQACSRILVDYCMDAGGKPEATVFGKSPIKVPAALAALANGTAGHAMDWDDTQLSSSPDRIYGLLTHPTMPPLNAALAVSERIGGATGRDFLTAFVTGFEVECKIAEAVYPAHYKNGFHSSGTIGTFGAAVAAGKLLGLNEGELRHVLGMAASMGAGIRVNFGTMTKPLHVGRAAQSGVTAAVLAASGFEADPDGLDGQWGYFKVTGGGFDLEKIQGAFGNPFSIVYPGVSIKPYPCGVLTHPSMDVMLAVARENDLKPEEIESAVLYAGSNILNPIRYDIATNELEAKFCMPFLLAAMAISRKAGVKEFTDEYVNSPQVQDMMRRITTRHDPDIEAKGFDKIRSRLEVRLKNGKTLVKEADEQYRGGPDNPLTEAELQEKFTDCASFLLDEAGRRRVFETVSNLEELGNIQHLIDWTTRPAGR